MELKNTGSRCVVCGGAIIEQSHTEQDKVIVERLFCRRCGLMYHHLFKEPPVSFGEIAKKISDSFEELEERMQEFTDILDVNIATLINMSEGDDGEGDDGEDYDGNN